MYSTCSFLSFYMTDLYRNEIQTLNIKYSKELLTVHNEIGWIRYMRLIGKPETRQLHKTELLDTNTFISAKHNLLSHFTLR